MDFDKIEVYGFKNSKKFLISCTILKDLSICENIQNDLFRIFGVDEKLLAGELKKRCEVYWKVSQVTAWSRLKAAGLETEKVGVRVYYFRPERIE